MKALVFHGMAKKSLDERPLPNIASPTDAIVRVTRTTICGTDLHILKGDVPSCEPGRVLGHEGVGVVQQVGPAVAAFTPGDHVLISCISSCGKCEECRRGMCCDRRCGANRPCGLAYRAVLCAGADHRDRSRQASPEVARTFGASACIDIAQTDAVAEVMKLTGGAGVDCAVEAVGVPSTFELCESLIAAGGTFANVGVHGVKADLHLETLWDRNISITTWLVDTVSTPMLLKTVRAGRLDPKRLITHRFTLDRILDAYETFGNAGDTQALKVIIEVS